VRPIFWRHDPENNDGTDPTIIFRTFVQR
jgi:hypothetical protein